MLVGAEMGISGLVDRQTLAEGEAAPGRQPVGIDAPQPGELSFLVLEAGGGDVGHQGRPAAA